MNNMQYKQLSKKTLNPKICTKTFSEVNEI